MLTACRESENYGNFRFIAVRQNEGSKLFFLLIWLPAGRQGRPATVRQADDVPIAIGECTVNASDYHILNRFLPFAGAIADI